MAKKTTHSAKFEDIKKWYNLTGPDGNRLWDAAKVKNAVTKGWITEKEYTEITGGDYVA